ncbi:putative ribonuclease H-like domain-containing protein [Tanacetum coccineum]
MSIDDLYNNFKIVKQSVKKSVGPSSGAQNLSFMTAPSTSSTNDTAKPAYEVSTVSPNVNTASPQVSTASFSDNVMYAFMVENPNGSNIIQQDLEQIYEDDLEAIDLKWQLSLLSMRAKRWDTLLGSVEHQGIRREYSVARTPQQNGVAERRNRSLIEAARTMLADSKLPSTFWAEVVSTACYVQNRVLVVKPHNKTPYELFRGKFDGKSDECFFVGYSLSSKAFRVYNTRTKKVEENLHIRFLKNKPMIEGNGPKWLFDIDSLTQSMNYVQVAVGTITNESVDLLTKGFDAGRFQYLVSSIGMLNP